MSKCPASPRDLRGKSRLGAPCLDNTFLSVGIACRSAMSERSEVGGGREGACQVLFGRISRISEGEEGSHEGP